MKRGRKKDCRSRRESASEGGLIKRGKKMRPDPPEGVLARERERERERERKRERESPREFYFYCPG